jgi:biopolymer transport protein ExbD
MATLSIPQNGKAVKGGTKKPLPSVDLTAMVDLAFLLITFFMLTTSLAKMKAMDVVKPVPTENMQDWADYPASRTMTVLLGKNNTAVYYMGEPAKAEMKTIDMAKVKTQIAKNKQWVAQLHQNDPSKYMIVIIKPTLGANYKIL